MPANSPILKGISTIVWGTTGKLGTPSGAIVQSISVTPKHSDTIGEIENGDGAGVALVLLDDGFSARVRCEYDTALTWPAIGDTVTLSLPKIGAAGGATEHSCYVTSISADLARKREATVEIGLIHRPGA